MKKEDADAFLKEWDEMDCSVKPQDFFSEIELESQKTILDWITIELESDIADYLGVNIFPSFVIIDENGIVTLRLAGRIGSEGFKSLISELDKRHLGGDIK